MVFGVPGLPKTSQHATKLLQKSLTKVIQNFIDFLCCFLLIFIDFWGPSWTPFFSKITQNGARELNRSILFLIFMFFHLLGVPPGPDLVDFGSNFGSFRPRFDRISAPTSNRETATTKHITKAKPQNSTTAIHPSFHAHNLSRSSASGTWLAEGLVGSREAIRI
jgi:hypothetical protein